MAADDVPGRARPFLGFESLFTPAMREDPYPVYEALRTQAPVFGPAPGIWILTRHADCAALVRDESMSRDVRRSRMYAEWIASGGTPVLAPDETPSMLFVDPPDHTRLRAVVSAAFSARRVEALRSRVAAIVRDLLAELTERETWDVVSDLASPLPVTVICELLGVPFEDRDRFGPWSADLVRMLDPIVPPDAMARAAEAAAGLRGYLTELIEERRAAPGDDLLSMLVEAEGDGGGLSRAEVLSTCQLLLIAGHETTRNLIGNGMLALLREPGEAARLRGHPALARSAVEELLRYDSPAQLTDRIATGEGRIDGQRIEAGDVVVALLGAANRDPEQFLEPNRLDLGRRDNRHLAFGGGIHFCLGASLARLEGQVAIPALVAAFPTLEQGGEPTWRETVTLRGLASLPVRSAS